MGAKREGGTIFMKDKVLLVGDGLLAQGVAACFREWGAQVFSLEEGESPSEGVTAVVDVLPGPVDRKRELLIRAERIVPGDTPVFTSALHVGSTRIASWLERPERVAGFSPLLLASMETVEVSRPLQGEEEPDWESLVRWWERFGKRVELLEDEPGLVFPRTLALMVNEATYMLMEKGATAEAIDLAMKKGTHHPQGPLEWADEVGVDQILWILTGLFEELGDDRYRPAPLLRRMVYAGRTGRAAGRGFHPYETARRGV